MQQYCFCNGNGLKIFVKVNFVGKDEKGRHNDENS